MKVLFTNPPWWGKCTEQLLPGNKKRDLWEKGVRAGSRWPHLNLVQKTSPDRYAFGDFFPYPFFMGYAASYLDQDKDIDVTFRDSIALCESYETYFKFIQENKFQYIFMESAESSLEEDKKLIFKINKIQPHAKIIITGPVGNPETLINDLPVHAILKGEYEKSAMNVVRNDLSGIIGYNFLTLEEMNKAPYPYNNKTYAYRYWDGHPVDYFPPQAQVLSSRGCPYKCIFCVWPAVMTGEDPTGDKYRQVRQYSGDYMQGLLEEWVGKYNYNSLYFDDDTFNLGDKHTIEMCEVMRRINIPWSAMCRADTIKKETWKIMKESGCQGVKIGFESGNQYVVDEIVNKKLNLEYAREIVEYISSIKMDIHGTFTYGLPGETWEQMQDTKNYIKTLKLTSYQESGTAEIEGTPLANLKKGNNSKKYSGAEKDSKWEKITDGAQKFREMDL